MIESDLEQAVGRARLLRYDCTVNLFSNFPLRQAVMRESDYDQLDTISMETKGILDKNILKSA
jgi:hypothetical protein